MLAWWRHVAPPKAQLHVVLALDGDRLAGVGPFFRVRDRLGVTRFGLLAAGTAAPVEPLAEEGLAEPVAAVLSQALAAARPAPGHIELDGVSSGSRWPELLAQSWPGKPPQMQRHRSEPVPAIDLDGVETLDDWFSSKSAHFRREMRRNRRRLQAAGATFRLAGTAEDVDRGLDAFARLHYANWSVRGGSAALDPAVERMLRDAAEALLDSGRFRVWSIDVDGVTIAGRVALAAGGELSLWLSGFDERAAKMSPSLQSSLTAIEDALGRRERRIVLGPGDQEWKYRLADGEDRVEWVSLLPSGPWRPVARGTLAAKAARGELSERLPAPVKARIKAFVRRVARKPQASSSPQ